MKQCLWTFVVLSSGLACAEDEAGSASPGVTASPSLEPSASSPVTGGAPEASTSSAPSSTVPGATGSMASAAPSGSPAEPEPNASNDPDPAATLPRPSDPSAPRPRPSVPASGGTDGAGGDANSSTDDGGAPPAGAGGMAGTGNGPEPLAGCEDGPLDAPLDGCAPEFEESGDFYADCVARINQLRWECQCLPPLERWMEGEDCADQHAQYDYEQDEAHAGISDDICENGGGSQNECPGYNPNFDVVNFCLQQMWDEGPGEDFQQHGHYINMSSSTVTKVACGLYITPEGDFWSVQNFTR